jgi:hypothetical protein
MSVRGKDTEAKPSDFCVSARRKGKFIDLDVYVDLPITEYEKGIPSVDEYAISSLGEEVYHRLMQPLPRSYRSLQV